MGRPRRGRPYDTTAEANWLARVVPERQVHNDRVVIRDTVWNAFVQFFESASKVGRDAI